VEPQTPATPREPSAEERALHARHFGWLRARCERLLAGAESAEAAALQALAGLIREGAGGDEAARLLKLSGDVCVERLRGQGRLDAEWRRLVKGAAPGDAPEGAALRAQILSRLPGLRPADRGLALDHWLDGRTAGEIARARGLAERAVTRRLERLRAALDERLREVDGVGLTAPAPPLDPASLPRPDEATLARLTGIVDALPARPMGGPRRRLADPGVWGPALALTAFTGLLLFMLWPAPPVRQEPTPLGPLTTSVELMRYRDGRPDRPVPGDDLPAGETLGLRVTTSEDRVMVVTRLPEVGPATGVPGLEYWPVPAGAPLDIPPMLAPGDPGQERLFFFFCSMPLSTQTLLALTAEAHPPGMDGRRDLAGVHLKDVADCQVRSLLLRRQR